MNIEKAIAKEKIKLIKITKKKGAQFIKGIYENFGQREVQKLQDKFINISDYSNEMNRKRRLIQLFDEWCMNFFWIKLFYLCIITFNKIIINN